MAVVPGQLIEAAIGLFGFRFARVEWEVTHRFRVSRRNVQCHILLICILHSTVEFL